MVTDDIVEAYLAAWSETGAGKRRRRRRCC